MSAHTPGPWVISRDKGEPVAVLPAGRDGEICQFATAYASEANARLIAAAPDLLEAVKALVNAYEVVVSNGGGAFQRHTPPAASLGYRAIAKAEGK